MIENRDTFRGAEIETPKAARGYGVGVSTSLAELEVWGSIVNSQSGIQGSAPAENGFGAF